MIRALTVHDAGHIQKINKESLGYDFSLEKITRKLEQLLVDSRHHILIGYEAQGKIVGYVHAEVYETLYFSTLLNVLALAVIKNNQRSGIGKKLMLALEEEAKNRGIDSIRLNSGATRTDAHAFYRSLGYDDEKLQKRLIKKIG